MFCECLRQSKSEFVAEREGIIPMNKTMAMKVIVEGLRYEQRSKAG